MSNVGINLIISARDMTAAGFASARAHANQFAATAGRGGAAARGMNSALVGSAAAGLKMASGLAAAAAATGTVYAGYRGLAGAFTAGSGFEAEMDRVAAVSGSTAEQMAMLENQALSLARSTKFTASEVAGAQSKMAMGGMSAAEIQAALPGTLALGAAGGLSVIDAADIQTNVLRAFSLQTAEAGRVADVLAVAATSANQDVSMLGSAFSKLAPVASAGGVSLEDAAAAISVVSDQGIQAEVAGTNLASMFLSLADSKQRAKLSEIGVDVTDAEGRFLGLDTVLDQLATVTNDDNRLTVVGEVFGKDQAKVVAALVNQGGAAVRSMRGQLLASAGAAEEISAGMVDNLQGDMYRLSSAWESLGIRLYSLAAPGLRDLVTGMGDAVNNATGWLEGFVQENGDLLIQWAAAARAQFVFVGELFGYVGSAAGSAFSYIAELFGWNTGTAAQWRDAYLQYLFAVEFAFTHWKDITTIAVLKVTLAFVTMRDVVVEAFNDIGRAAYAATGVASRSMLNAVMQAGMVASGNRSLSNATKSLVGSTVIDSFSVIRPFTQDDGRSVEAVLINALSDAASANLTSDYGAFVARRMGELSESADRLSQRFGAQPGVIDPPSQLPPIDGPAEMARAAMSEVASALPSWEESRTSTAMARRYQEEQGLVSTASLTADSTAKTAEHTGGLLGLFQRFMSNGTAADIALSGAPTMFANAILPGLGVIAEAAGSSGFLGGLFTGPPAAIEAPTGQRTKTIFDVPLEVEQRENRQLRGPAGINLPIPVGVQDPIAASGSSRPSMEQHSEPARRGDRLSRFEERMLLLTEKIAAALSSRQPILVAGDGFN